MNSATWTRRQALAAAAAALWSTRAGAQATGRFPDRPLRLLVPAGPGGVQDVQTRRVLPIMSEALGQQVIVENLPGAAGGIALEQLVRAAPDGHTLAMAPVAIAVLPHLMKAPYDTLADLLPVSMLSAGPFVLAAPASAPYDDLAGMVAHARRSGSPPAIGGFGNGSLAHLTVLLLGRATGLAFAHVPYGGGAQQVTDLVGGQVPLLLDFVPSLRAHLASGRVKALAMTGARRLDALPQVPTFAEQGAPGMTVVAWQGIVVRTGTPDGAVRALHRAFAQALADPAVHAAFVSDGAEIGGQAPEAFGAFVRAEHARWGQLIREAGVKLG